MPKAFSKALHALSGSHKWGTVESMKDRIRPSGRSSFSLVSESENWMEFIPTTRSRDISLAKLKVTSLGTTREES